MIVKPTASVVLAAALVVTGAASASAHECYVAKRSDQGNAGASHSANWFTLEVTELYASAHYFVPGIEAPLTEQQIGTAVEMTVEAGIPTSFTLFEKFTIPRSLDEMGEVEAKSVDGKGVDHFFLRYGEELQGIALAASQS